MSKKILITIFENEIAPRFDLTTEVILITLSKDGSFESEKTKVLSHASTEDLCHMILTEGISVVICGGIEEEFYEYLLWKKVKIIDSVMAAWSEAINSYRNGTLEAGAILFDK